MVKTIFEYMNRINEEEKQVSGDYNLRKYIEDIEEEE